MNKTLEALVSCLALMLLAGCGAGVTTVRNGRPTTLPSGPPASACEREGFYELAPAQVFTKAEQSIVINVESAPTGQALFQAGELEPLYLPDVLDGLGEPELASTHLLRVEAINAKLARRGTWRAIGLPVMLGGLVASTSLMIAGAATDDLGLVGIGGIGLGVTLVASVIVLVGVLLNTPTALEQIHADTRNRLFLADEDDLSAVARGVDRHNLSVRAACR